MLVFVETIGTSRLFKTHDQAAGLIEYAIQKQCIHDGFRR